VGVRERYLSSVLLTEKVLNSGQIRLGESGK
jgi:hypothetical protein